MRKWAAHFVRQKFITDNPMIIDIFLGNLEAGKNNATLYILFGLKIPA